MKLLHKKKEIIQRNTNIQGGWWDHGFFSLSSYYQVYSKLYITNNKTENNNVVRSVHRANLKSLSKDAVGFLWQAVYMSAHEWKCHCQARDHLSPPDKPEQCCQTAFHITIYNHWLFSILTNCRLSPTLAPERTEEIPPVPKQAGQQHLATVLSTSTHLPARC